MKGLLVGSPNFSQGFEPLLKPLATNEDFLCSHRFAARPPLSTLLPAGLAPAERNAALTRAFLEHAYTLSELGAAVGRPSTTVWHWIRRARRADSAPAPLLTVGSDPD
jgi:hypothetical protein